MADDPHITIRPNEQSTSIEFPSEGLTTSATVTRVGDGLYQLDSVPILAESVSFRDIIEADLLPDGRLRFKRVIEKSGWRVFDFLLTHEFVESEKLVQVLARADSLGAYWERVFGGCLYICVPPGVNWDPTAELSG